MAGLPLAEIHRKKMNIEQLVYNAISSVSSYKLALVALLYTHLLKEHHGWSTDIMGKNRFTSKTTLVNL